MNWHISYRILKAHNQQHENVMLNFVHNTPISVTWTITAASISEAEQAKLEIPSSADFIALFPVFAFFRDCLSILSLDFRQKHKFYNLDFLRVIRFSPVRTIPPLLHNHVHLHVARTTSKNGLSLGTFQKAMLFWKSDSTGENRPVTLF
jgi:hypothetical protein